MHSLVPFLRAIGRAKSLYGVSIDCICKDGLELTMSSLARLRRHFEPV